MISKPKGFKKLLSYFYEFDIKHLKGEYGDNLILSFSKARWKLSTENVVYSFEDLYTVYRIAFELLGFQNRIIQNTLCLGFGLGSIPIILNKKYNIKNFIGIENDTEIIKLFNNLYDKNSLGQLKIAHTDAYTFINEYKGEKLDLITLDIFTDTKVPVQFEEKNFVKQLKDNLAPEGLLLYNRLITQKEKKKTVSFYETTFKSIFTKSKALVINQNLMLCGFN